ncbi:hypothetical protein MCUN1_002275 [Malassezia cuniculi]|uniref:Sugar phosphate transporter domain-containing protein n=1 Tax=Malassezia cuniculi TaxID=948313 RepID=A0AAF0ERP4_9BASI|nr:hypothetical protein MCUN1_002275 [Malassezia cuniculi]
MGSRARLGRAAKAERAEFVHDARARTSSTVLLVLLCLLWYLSSALSSNTSKALMSRKKIETADGHIDRLPSIFPYPVTLTLVQFVFVNAFCYVGTRRSLLGDFVLSPRLVPLTAQRMREVGQISVFNVIGHALGSVALSRVPVSMVHTIKALSPLFTVLAYAYFFQVAYSRRTYVSLVPLMTGVVLACSTLSTSSDDVIGFAAALGSTFIFVAQNIYSKKLLKPADAVSTAPEKMDKINILFYSSACSVVLMFPMYLFYDAPRMAAYDAPPWTLRVFWLIFVNGVVHFAQNLLAFQVLTHVSPVTYSVANLFKRVFVILLAIVWFRQQVTLIQWIGIALTFVGLYMYNNTKAHQEKPNSAVLPIHMNNLQRAPPSARQQRTMRATSDVAVPVATPLFSLPPQ